MIFGRFWGGHRPWRWRPGGFFTAGLARGRKESLGFCVFSTFFAFLARFLPVFGPHFALFSSMSCAYLYVHNFPRTRVSGFRRKNLAFDKETAEASRWRLRKGEFDEAQGNEGRVGGPASAWGGDAPGRTGRPRGGPASGRPSGLGFPVEGDVASRGEGGPQVPAADSANGKALGGPEESAGPVSRPSAQIARFSGDAMDAAAGGAAHSETLRGGIPSGSRLADRAVA